MSENETASSLAEDAVPGAALSSELILPGSERNWPSTEYDLKQLDRLRTRLTELGFEPPDDESEWRLDPEDLRAIREALIATFEVRDWDAEILERLIAHGLLGPDQEPIPRENLLRESKILRLIKQWELEQDALDRFRERLNPVEPLVWTNASQRRARPPLRWFIDGLVIDDAVVGMMFGDQQTYKSFLVVDLALSVVNKLPDWMGWSINSSDGPTHAGIVLMEGVPGIQQRIDSWLEFHRPDHPHVTDDGLLTLENPVVNISSAASMDRLVASIRATTVNGEPFTPRVLAVDTQGLALGDADEYNRPAMRQAYRLVRKLAAEFGCLVLLITHPGHSNKHRPAGASTQEQDSDLVLRVAQNSVFVKKNKEGENGVKRFFTVEKIGESLVSRWVGEKNPLAEAIIERNQRDNALVAAVRELQQEKPSGVSKSAVHTRLGGNKQSLYNDIDRLVIEGRLRNNSQRESDFKLTTDEEPGLA